MLLSVVGISVEPLFAWGGGWCCIITRRYLLYTVLTHQTCSYTKNGYFTFMADKEEEIFIFIKSNYYWATP